MAVGGTRPQQLVAATIRETIKRQKKETEDTLTVRKGIRRPTGGMKG